jgi:hypothetical protein
MKFQAPDKSLLIDVGSVKEHPSGLVLEGKIMGTMPMKAVLTAEELRSAFSLLTWRVTWRAFRMLIRGKSVDGGKKPA